MRTRFTKSFSFARVVVTCLVMCVFFAQSALVASVHQGEQHHATASGKLVASSSQNCQGDSADSGNRSGSHIHHSDCCQFCQSSVDEFDYLAVLESAQVIAVLMPPEDGTVYASRYERAVAGSELNGLKSTWSAQAPPKA